MKTINGNILRKAIIFGINELDKNKGEINSLNVFPVPDGDTGTNMTMTAYSAGKEVEKLSTTNISTVAKAASSGSLRGARGNSGVILSQLFRGFAKGVEGKEEIDAKGFSVGFVKAMEAAYKAVMKPKEGTILTIAKALAESATEISKREENIEIMLKEMIVHGHKVLVKTQFMLPELREAKVIDAGGRGLLYVLEGALNANYSHDVALNSLTAAKDPQPTGVLAATGADIKFAYCTEMFIDLATKSKKNFEEIEDEMLKYLDSMGDSVVLVGDENIVKIHIHTNNPGAVLENSLKYGDLSNIKIDNMRLQHEEIVSFATDIQTKPTIASDTDVVAKKIAILAVASGAGFKDIFLKLNADTVIEGGQTMNPSTDCFLQAIDKMQAADILILPNNSNIILAAQQAQKMTKKSVHVLNTKTLPEGIAAMYNYNIDADIFDNLASMEEGVKNTFTGQVTYAVKDSAYKDITIKKGDIICMLNNEIVDTKTNVQEAATALITTMAETKKPEFINIYYGEEADEKGANLLKEHIETNYPSIEVEAYNGGQSHYYYVISAE
ncbi:MAG: DAK2 domain-containing protein [Defluviitaleaceae bacterium]|nr:DAK2 domain-containing protein [Defluviitaleaceae bacterium]